MAQLYAPHFQAVDADGVPISGAKLYFYLAGTTTPTTTYQDAAATTPHTNPVIADSAGLFAPIFLDLAVTFKVVLKDADDITVQTADRINPAGTGLNGGLYVVGTRTQLLAITPDTEFDEGRVLNDSDPTKNGYYYRSGAAWVKGRGFPDSFAALTVTGGTQNAVQASANSAVNPADIGLFRLTPTATNTGAMTLSISGATAKPLRAFDGTVLAAGYVQVGSPVLLYDDGAGKYRLFLDHRFQTLADQVASDRDEAVDAWNDFEAQYLGAKASDPTTDNDGGALVDGAIYWNTSTKVFRAYDASTAAWYSTRYTFAGSWSGGTAYLANALVETGGSIWLSLRNSTGVAPVEGLDWTLFLPGVSAADASITPVKLASGARASRLNIEFSTDGAVFAFGGNSRTTTFTRGLQIGGGHQKDGESGTTVALEGHASWVGLFPSKNYSSLELALHPTMASGGASVTAGSNVITRTSGALFSTSWIGRKVYFDEGIYLIAAVPTTSTMTITAIGGGAYNFPANSTDVYRVCYVHGTGTCNVVGSSVQQIQGDPFVVYFSLPSFELLINGTPRTVSANPSVYEYTLSAPPGNVSGATYEFFFDVNDQWSTIRLHATEVDNENVSLFSRYDGYWLQSQYGGYGKYRKIFLSTGERVLGEPNKQIVLQKNGDVSIGGDYEAEVIRALSTSGFTPANRFDFSAAPTGFSPSIRMSGSDANIGLSIDAKGTTGLALGVTNNNFGTFLFGVGKDYFYTELFPLFADDAAAAAGGVAIGQHYCNSTIGANRQRRS